VVSCGSDAEQPGLHRPRRRVASPRFAEAAEPSVGNHVLPTNSRAAAASTSNWHLTVPRITWLQWEPRGKPTAMRKIALTVQGIHCRDGLPRQPKDWPSASTSTAPDEMSRCPTCMSTPAVVRIPVVSGNRLPGVGRRQMHHLHEDSIPEGRPTNRPIPAPECPHGRLAYRVGRHEMPRYRHCFELATDTAC
jgi:hypothetical protein